ncbi:choice-of-anchor L domain-containing protein, partial [Psychroflexus sp. MBR-150]
MKYIYTIFIICLSYFSSYAQNFNIQNASFDICSGNFFDTGGLNGDYDNNESFVFTICPEEFGFSVLEFSEFDIGDDGDTMIIYNSDTNDPAAEIGTFTGGLADNPELQYITANNDVFIGCLTIEFISNASTVSTGWAASISCREGDVFTIEDGTTDNTCVGLFTDSGGTNGSYADNENFIYTICPDVSNLFTILEFKEFQLQDGFDTLIVYDSDTNDPAAEIGTFTGNLADNPELQLIAASENNPTRCLTFEFISDGSITDLGWVAEIKCQENMFPISNGTVNTCEGLFTDTGGANDEYANNENFVYTICSDDPDFISVLEFQEFQLQDGVDTMIIYDSDTNDPAFEIGTFTGDLANNPQLQSIIATEDSPSGCLTIEFISDGSVTDIGWSAYISCKERFLISDGPLVNTCSGNFFDSGGASGDYDTGENFTYTICPDGPNLQTILEFNEFILANDGVDQMTIYDADNPDPATILGTFTGTLAGNPELNLIAATNANPSGCLTVVFTSNTFFNAPGWEAAISCRPPCQTITPEVANIEPLCSEGPPVDFIIVGENVTFEADAVTSSGVTNDLTYEWDFDGTILNGQNVSITFTNPDEFIATLTVTDSFGCFETLEFPVIVAFNTIFVDDNFDQDEDKLTLDELVEDILVKGACSDVNNINSSNNSSLNGEPFESFGYFNKVCTNFPFDEGIVMGSADINRVIDGNGSSGSGGWPGDTDLEALIQEPGNTNNATIIEFEFKPFVNQIQFNYIFASYEYPIYVCDYADTFAFILSGPGISNVNDYDHDGNPNTADVTLDLGGLNIALVPGTTTPVSPVNVHDETSCTGGLGEFAFPEFYDSTNSEANNPGDIDITGRTRVLTAQADVIPCQTYNIKLVIADRADTFYDSFVFLEGGSFELGADAGEDFLIEDSTAKCEGDFEVLQVFDGEKPPCLDLQWSKDGVDIPGETEATLIVTETGEYCVTTESNSSNPDDNCESSEDCVIVEFIPLFDENEDITENLDIIICLPFNEPASFNLTLNDVPILDNIRNTFFNDFPDYQTENPGVEPYQVTYYETAQDAIDGVNPILNPQNYSPPSIPFTVHYSVSSTIISECLDTGSFLLDVTASNIGTLEDLSECSDIAGVDTATFDLTQNDANVLNGEDLNNFEVLYYESQQDAINGTNPIPDPAAYENTSNPQIIWAKQDNLESAACFDISSFEIEVFQIPEITIPPEDLTECGDFTLTQTFDLTQNDEAALGISNPADAQLTYHNTLGDADTGDNPIVNPTAYQPSNNPETIFIRAENINNPDCFSTDSFEIEIFNVEANQADDLERCEMTGNTGQSTFDLTLQNADVFGPNQDETTHSISYHDTEADALGATSPIPNPATYVNSNNPETIWVSVQNLDDPTCIAVSSFEIIITEQPEITQTPTLTQCGDFTLTQAFDLTENDVTELGILNPTETQLSYYNTAADADAATNVITTPGAYVPSNDTETIFVRAENTDDSTCFSVGSFTIQIFDVEIITPNDLELCDDGSGTGTASFNLTENNFVVLGSNQDPSTHSVSYHESQPDANGGVNPIPDPTAYQNTSNPQPIWVRVQNIADPTCFELASFELSVTDSAPVDLNPPNIVECDDDNDGFFNNFDLSSQDDVISLANPDVQVSYHLTQSDAENNVGALSSPYSNVVESVQTIYFRTEDINNSCSLVSSFELQVVDSPILTPIEDPLSVCDDNTDGFLFFDLTQVEPEVLGSLAPTNLDITYHLNETDAETDQNEIAQPTNYQNTSSPQTIWIRVTDTSNAQNCFNIESFDIEVLPLPAIVDAEPLAVCDDETGGNLSDEIATFDLNDKIDEITQGNNELNVEFFETPTDLANNNPITPIDSYVNTTNPQTIEVRVTSQTTGCESFSSLTLVVDPIPSLAPTLEPLEVCDPDNDGFAEFDLEAAIIDILNNEPEVTITFHLTQADADLGVNPIDTTQPFGTNNPNQQTLYVRAENTGPNGDDGTGCYDTRPLDLIVIPSPEIQNLEDLTRCDDETANGFASFDLTQNTPEALGNQDPTNIQITYHETQQDAEDGINAIAVPSNYTNITNPQIIYVRIENTATGCVDLFDFTDDTNNSFTLTVEPLPAITAPSVLEVCDDDANQNPFPQISFDLTVKEAEIVGQTVVPANLQFTYYESQADLDNDNPITDPTDYTNTSQPQSIFIKVVDTATENQCFDTVIMTISVLPLPSPSETDPDALRLEACDDNNDGVAAEPFDLTQSGNLIAGSENVSISYYLNESGAENEDAADLITTPDAYVNDPSLNETDANGNPTNTQIIYARVDNAVAGNFCFVIVPFEIVVHRAPVLNPNGNPFAYTLCEDDDTNP